MGFFDSLFGSGKSDKKAGNNTTGDAMRSGLSNIPTYKEEFSEDISTEIPTYKEEFSKDISTEIHRNDAMYYSTNGVSIENIPNTIRVIYDGKLTKNGAQEIIAVIGYGANDNWQDVEYHPMKKVDQQKFELMVPRKRFENVNVAFKDTTENWDNNEGMNYVLSDFVNQGIH